MIITAVKVTFVGSYPSPHRKLLESNPTPKMSGSTPDAAFPSPLSLLLTVRQSLLLQLKIPALDKDLKSVRAKHTVILKSVPASKIICSVILSAMTAILVLIKKK